MMTKSRILTMLAAVLLALSATAASNSDSTYTIIISLDGFRWDYPDTYDCPFLTQMSQQGVKAVMQPSFPSKTFPNHYTLATGLVPDHHGIISNTFEIRSTGQVYSLSLLEARTNPAYYGGDPIWLTAKRQGVKTATVYWVGSDVAIKGDHATYWHDYLKKPRLTLPQRTDEILRLLNLPAAKRPHLIMAYFEQPDANGHNYGPISPETRRAMEYMDLLLEDMWQRIAQLPIASKVNLIVTGDHGMTWLSPERHISPAKYLKREWIARMDNDFPVLINASAPHHVDNIVEALSGVDHIRVWRRGELPTYLNYGNNENMADVIVLPDVGWYFSDSELKNLGSHGFDHTAADMQVAFRAMGPAFKQGYVRGTSFRNVCIYPLLAHLLGVEPSPCDGTLDEVADLLR